MIHYLYTVPKIKCSENNCLNGLALFSYKKSIKRKKSKRIRKKSIIQRKERNISKLVNAYK